MFGPYNDITIRDWATRLHLFRYCIRQGGHANDGDVLLVAYRYDSVEKLKEFFCFLKIPLHHLDKPPTGRVDEPDAIPGTKWIQQPGHSKIIGFDVFIWCYADTIEINLANPVKPYEVEESDVCNAEEIEKVLMNAPLEAVDPPLDYARCVCPKWHPEYFS